MRTYWVNENFSLILIFPKELTHAGCVKNTEILVLENTKQHKNVPKSKVRLQLPKKLGKKKINYFCKNLLTPILNYHMQ